MPLKKSASKKAFKENIKAEISAGKPRKQAVPLLMRHKERLNQKIIEVKKWN